ncbi:MAG TPA: alpha/beta hydrolase [Capsulimonadaceae bacterium]|jgi:pimeloyl-ACP methyl ester carboxylesterase
MSRHPSNQPPDPATIRSLSLPGVGGIAIGDPTEPALICLHGWGGSKEIWRRFLTLHGHGRYIVSLDMPGTWGSTPLDAWGSEQLVGWLFETADRLGIERFSLMGHSMGGNTAAHAALFAPKRIEKLILVNAAVYSDRLPVTRAYVAPGHGPFVVELARIGSGIANSISVLFPERNSGGTWRPWLRRCGYVYHHNKAGVMHNQLKAMVESPFTPLLLPGSLPVLVVHGERDTVVPVALARKLWDDLSKRDGVSDRSRLIVYPHAQHVPMDTDPLGFARDIRAFLDSGEEA